ncbi:alpha/beta fold hydrolase [Pseudomarimonas arenosa]|uniref:Alpha/beta hydrolase n=1 Tax=Pseudomarimonas arenosa TaxID=2774145 RepID=A0AAW3ZN88_9GAMM|nr:alpha/beta hydrolase [Pseudomarimonas arenosa]MBD8526644.1 alpha/beta hydrolase [Pseudomarimonas arenosa]
MSAHWLLLRGLTREARHWGDFPRRLSRELDVEVRCLDLPGNGERARDASPDDLQATLQACRTALAPERSRGPRVLVAMSMGAMLSCLWASQHPDEVAGAVLINTSLRPFSPWYRRLRPANYPRVLSMAVGGHRRHWEAQVLQMTSRRVPLASEVGQQLIDHWMAIGEQAPVTRANAWRQLRAALRFRAPLVAPKVPLLLLSSAGDRLVDPACTADLAEAWQLPYQLHPWAGHDLPLDDPEWVVAQIRAWQNDSLLQDPRRQSG